MVLDTAGMCGCLTHISESDARACATTITHQSSGQSSEQPAQHVASAARRSAAQLICKCRCRREVRLPMNATAVVLLARAKSPSMATPALRCRHRRLAASHVYPPLVPPRTPPPSVVATAATSSGPPPPCSAGGHRSDCEHPPSPQRLCAAELWTHRHCHEVVWRCG